MAFVGEAWYARRGVCSVRGVSTRVRLFLREGLFGRDGCVLTARGDFLYISQRHGDDAKRFEDVFIKEKKRKNLVGTSIVCYGAARSSTLRRVMITVEARVRVCVVNTPPISRRFPPLRPSSSPLRGLFRRPFRFFLLTGRLVDLFLQPFLLQRAVIVSSRSRRRHRSRSDLCCYHRRR